MLILEVTSVASWHLSAAVQKILADITDADGELLTIHCPNTGAMTGCTEPGSKIYYSRSDNQKRKYPHTLEFVETVNGLVSVNTGRANSLVKDALLGGRIAEVGPLTPNQVKPEAAIPSGAGRFDFQLSQGDDITFIEVKSVTLH